MITVLLWLVALNTSSKQTWRYALPVVPLALLVSASLVVSLLESFSKLRGLRRLPICGVCLCGALQASELWSWRPYPELYFSPLSGGLAGAAARNHILPLTGHREALAFLLEQKRRGDERPRITVLGDAETQQYTLKNFFPERATALRFGDFPVWQSDYLMIFNGSGYPVDQARWGATLAIPPVFEYVHRGVTMLSVYRAAPYAGGEPINFAPDDFHLPNAVIGSVPGKAGRQIIVRQGSQTAGYVYFLDGLNLAPGLYRFEQDFELLDGAPLAGKDEFLRLEVPEVCSAGLALDALRVAGRQTLGVDCQIGAGTALFPRVFWSGSASFAAGEMRVTQLR